MLKVLRTGAQSRTAKILFALLLLSFVTWGIGPILRSGGHLRTAASVGSVKISEDEVQRMLQEGLRRIEAQTGTVPSQEIIDGTLRPSLLQKLAVMTLFEQEAHAVGVRVSPTLLQQTIAAEPAFRTEDGKFDKDKYRSLLQTVGLSEADYLRSLGQDVGQSMLRGVVSAGAEPPALLVKTLAAYKGEKRVVDALFIANSAMPAPAAPTADELKAAYEKNAEHYRAPEYRSFSYTYIDVKKLGEKLSFSEDELKKAYDEAAADYAVPEQRDVLLLTTSDKAEAEKVAAEAKTKGLAAAAKAANLMARPLKGVSKADILPALAETVFSLEKGKVSAALQTPLGWHVLAVEGIAPAHEKGFEEARAALRDRLAGDKANEAASDISRKLEDEMAGGATLEEAATKLGLEVKKVESVTQGGEKLAGGKLDDAMLVASVLPIAFATPAGENSAIHDLPEGLMALHVDTVLESQIRPLEDVKAQVEKAWVESQRAEAATGKAKELAEKAKAGEALSGGEKIGPIARTDAGSGKIPALLVGDIFRLKKGEATTGLTEAGSWVLRLDEVQPHTPTDDELKAERDDVLRFMADDRFVSYGQALWKHYGVTIGGQKMKPPTD